MEVYYVKQQGQNDNNEKRDRNATGGPLKMG